MIDSYEMAICMKRKTIFIIGFGVIFIILFIVSHAVLSKVILHYQKMPATETAEAYQIISDYKQQVIDFYQTQGRCPVMADKSQIVPEVKAYTYVSTIRLLADPQSNSCFIVAVMRTDTPSVGVKGELLTIAYQADQSNQGAEGNWLCYTSITHIYTLEACRNRPLPMSFQRALADYERNKK